MSFPCTNCGLCCKFAADAIGKVPGFNEPVKEDGSCAHLTPDNLCAIYETRPEACRIPKDQYRANAEACNQLITLIGLDKKYLIPVDGL